MYQPGDANPQSEVSEVPPTSLRLCASVHVGPISASTFRETNPDIVIIKSPRLRLMQRPECITNVIARCMKVSDGIAGLWDRILVAIQAPTVHIYIYINQYVHPHSTTIIGQHARSFSGNRTPPFPADPRCKQPDRTLPSVHPNLGMKGSQQAAFPDFGRKNPKSRTTNSGHEYSYGVESRALRGIYFLDPVWVQAAGSGRFGHSQGSVYQVGLQVSRWFFLSSGGPSKGV